MYRNVALHALPASDIAVVWCDWHRKQKGVFFFFSELLFSQLTTTPGVVPLEGQKVRRHVLIKHEKSKFAVVFYFLFCGGDLPDRYKGWASAVDEEGASLISCR
jgi:hypothetical protein